MCCAAAGFSARWVSSRPSILRLVWLTNKFSFDPPEVYEIVEPQQPAIFAFWHGQHFMTPFIKTKDSHRGKVLISRHRDGEYNAIAAERLGIGTIRGSGDHGSAFHRKGGVGAFKEMVRALEDNYNIALTADVPKRSRVAGLGIIMLARESGGLSCHLRWRPAASSACTTGTAPPSICHSGEVHWWEARSLSFRPTRMPRPWKTCARDWRRP